MLGGAAVDAHHSFSTEFDANRPVSIEGKVTTLVGQKTKTSPFGRNTAEAGFPIRACEMLATLEAPVFIERCAVDTVRNVVRSKKAIRKALENQVNGKGYSFVEFLSMCPTNWGMSPQKAAEWVGEAMAAYYPLGNFRDR